MINRDIVGQTPYAISKMVGFEVPENATELLVKMPEEFDIDDVLNKEILCPMIRYHVYDDFKSAVKIARTKLKREGAGNSSCVFSNDSDEIAYASEKLPVGRLAVNQMNLAVGGATHENGLDPTVTMGSGFWGGNSTSDNMTYKQLRNITRVSFPLKGRKPIDMENIFKD